MRCSSCMRCDLDRAVSFFLLLVSSARAEFQPATKQQGTAAATKLIDGEVKQLKTYAAGDFFGERALIKNEPRAANIVATSDVLKCYRVER